MAWNSGLLEQLRRGELGRFRPHGNSMTPLIKSGQLVTVEPLELRGDRAGRGERFVEIGDAVFCKVGGRFMLHKVTAFRAGQYQISNNHGHVNGWTMAKNLFGLVTQVEP